MDNLTGQTIKGYELREQVGAGGFGAVYRAYQTSVGREVAVKVILPIHANQPDFVRRFEVEAQLVARLEHPHIVPLYDYWRDPDGAYLVMRWLRGNLRDSLGRTAWSSELAARLLDQVAGALTVAHREGVIHRDIKPDNILLDEDDNAYLADFGIAKDLNVRDITEGDSLIGSPAYLSPEQIRGETVTERADIYSLGLVIYEALAGEKAFPGATTPAELIYKQLNAPLPPLTMKKPQLPTALNEVLETATAKDPAHRYANVLRFAAAFRAALPSLQRRPAQPLAEPLTEREMDILRLMVAGMDNPEIAQKLVLSPATIKWYVKQIYTKLDAHSRHQAIERAQDLRLLEKPGRATPMMDDSPTVHEIIASAMRQREALNPYKGLRAFQESDAADYFGRAALTEHLLARLAESGESAHFLAVVGPSGSGKSSAVKAGLIPALRKSGLPNSGRWFISEMMPGTHPLEELEAALLKVAVNPLPGLLDQLREDRRGLVRAVKRLLPNEPEVELALVIDQFEEAFTLVEDEEARNHFLDLLLAAVTDPRSRVRVILTLRADFYDRPLSVPRLAELVRSHTEAIVPLTPPELERAISGPAERVGLNLEDGLVTTMVNEVSQQAGALPLLQYALTELYERREGQTMTLAAYQAMGGISGALAKRADEIYDGLDEASQAAAKQMFLRLVTLGEGAEDTRRRALLGELRALSMPLTTPPPSPPRIQGGEREESSAMDDALDAFGQHRMLTFDRDPLTRGPTAEVAHEALIREWKRLREWLDTSREDIQMQRQLATMSEEWLEANQDTSLLARGTRLERLEQWAAETGLALTPAERDFLTASVSEREKQAAAETVRQARENSLERRSVTFLRALVVVLLLAVLGAFGLTAVAVNQSQIAQAEQNNAQAARREAQNQAHIAQEREVVSYAVANLDDDPELSLLLALQAVNLTYNVDGSALPEAEAILHRGIEALPSTIPSQENYPTQGGAPVLFSPDSREIATTIVNFDQPATTKIWDAASRRLLFTLPGNVVSSTWADQTLITYDHNPDNMLTFTQWDVSSGQGGQQISTVTLPLSIRPTSLSVAQNFTLVAVVTNDATSLWDLKTGQLVDAPVVQNLPKTRWSLSPDGKRLGVLDGGGQVLRVFDTATWLELYQLTFNCTCTAVQFSPDSSKMITSHNDGTSNVRDAATGVEMYTVSSGDQPSATALSADATRLATGSPTGQIIVWDTTSQHELLRFTAPEGISQLNFSSDGRQLVGMLQPSGMTLVWNIAPDHELLTLVNDTRIGQSNPQLSVSYSPDGQELVATNENATPIIWDANTGERLITLSGPGSRLSAATWMPDGTHIAVVGNGTVTILDAHTGEAVPTLTGSTGSVLSIAYSSDGTRFATSGSITNKTVHIWDNTTGQELQVLTEEKSNISSVAFSPDERRVADAGNSWATVWDALTGEQLLALAGIRGRVNSIAFSPGGQQIAIAGGDHLVKIFDVQTGDLLRTLTGHTEAVTSVAYSPDGTRLASASDDGTIKFWDTNTGQELFTLNGAPEGVGDVAFSPDGTRLATQNLDGTTRIYVLPIPDLIALAQSRLTRTLTTDECQRYLHVDTCPANGG